MKLSIQQNTFTIFTLYIDTLSHLFRMEYSTWTVFKQEGCRVRFVITVLYRNYFILCKCSVASDLGLYCLSMSLF